MKDTDPKRPPIANYSRLANNRGPETLKGPVHPYFDTVMDENGLPADNRNQAAVHNAKLGEPNAEKYLDTDSGVC